MNDKKLIEQTDFINQRPDLHDAPGRAAQAQGEGAAPGASEILVLPSDSLQTRTTAAGRHCKRCGDPTPGRHRNGFCSDRCRMAARREVAAARRQGVLQRLRDAVRAVEQELLDGAKAGERR